MIVTSSTMKKIESASNLSTTKLMDKAGKTVAKEIKKHLRKNQHVLILCGSGNNGGDGFVVANALKDYSPKVLLIEGEPKTKEALSAYKKLSSKMIVKNEDAKEAIQKASVIVDAVYGFGYHGKLKAATRKIFKWVNASKAHVYSIDINSGAEADTSLFDEDAIRSTITYALDCYKPFHMLRKDHQLFGSCELLDLGLPHKVKTNFYEMDEDSFINNFPRKPEDAYKGSYGKTCIIGGSYGMAGALMFNIMGARCVGAPYIECGLPHEIYNIVAEKYITTVYHPFGADNMVQMLEPIIKNAKASLFGSGVVNLNKKQQCLDLVLQSATTPVVIDAEGLRLLHHNTYVFQFVKCPLILTPHIGEFAQMLNLPVETVMKDRLGYATKFAKQHDVTVVLKGPHTIVASPDGKVYINQSGNEALAQAGSGDLFAGILVGMLTFVEDVFLASMMAVWFHGKICDDGCQLDAIQTFPLEIYPLLSNAFFKGHGY